MVAEQISNLPFYLDWKFWSAAVALLALILSQLPPLYVLFRRPKLDVEAYSQIHIAHKVGNPNVQMHIILSNSGGRELRVRGIDLVFNRDGNDEFTLPAKNYFQSPNDNGTVMLTSFKLKPEEEWAHLVNFLNFFPREEDLNYRQLESNLRHDILSKKALLQDKDQSVLADDENAVPLIDIFERKFRWRPGEYAVTLRIKTNPENIFKDKKFRITIFESDSLELRSYSQDYASGFGVFLESKRHIGLLVPLSEA